MFKGITKRWMLNTLSVIFTIIVLIVVSLIFVITYVYQSSVEQTLSSAGNELSLVFSDYESDNTTSFNSSAREYVENFDRKEQMEVIVINSSGRVIMTSTGFTRRIKLKCLIFRTLKTTQTVTPYGTANFSPEKEQ